MLHRDCVVWCVVQRLSSAGDSDCTWVPWCCTESYEDANAVYERRISLAEKLSVMLLAWHWKDGWTLASSYGGNGRVKTTPGEELEISGQLEECLWSELVGYQHSCDIVYIA